MAIWNQDVGGSECVAGAYLPLATRHRWDASRSKLLVECLINITKIRRSEYDEASSIDNKGWMGVE